MIKKTILSVFMILMAFSFSSAESPGKGRLANLKELRAESFKIAAEHNAQKAQFEGELQRKLNALGSTPADRERRRQLIEAAAAKREAMQAAYREKMAGMRQKEDAIRHPETGQVKVSEKKNFETETKSIRDLAEKKRQQDILLQAERGVGESRKPITIFEGSESPKSSQLKLPPPPPKKYGIKDIEEPAKNNNY